MNQTSVRGVDDICEDRIRAWARQGATVVPFDWS